MTVCVFNDETSIYNPDALKALDYAKLRRHKQFMLGIYEKASNNKQKGYALGILNLLDNLQDYAVNDCGVPYEEVFGDDRD